MNRCTLWYIITGYRRKSIRIKSRIRPWTVFVNRTWRKAILLILNIQKNKNGVLVTEFIYTLLIDKGVSVAGPIVLDFCCWSSGWLIFIADNNSSCNEVPEKFLLSSSLKNGCGCSNSSHSLCTSSKTFLVNSKDDGDCLFCASSFDNPLNCNRNFAVKQDEYENNTQQSSGQFQNPIQWMNVRHLS